MKHTSAVLVYGNHGDSPIQLIDIQSLLEEALEYCQVPLFHSRDIVPGKLNFVIEHFVPEERVAAIIAAKRQDPNTEFICIATEAITGSTFNDFADSMTEWRKHLYRKLDSTRILKLFNFCDTNLSKIIDFTFPGSDARIKNSSLYRRFMVRPGHYLNLRYWQERFDNFILLTPYFKSIWCMGAHQMPGFERCLPNAALRLMPMVSFRTRPTMKQPDIAKKDIDFLFTGTRTEYRDSVFNQLEARGYKVVVGPATWPDYLREHFLKRTKVCLDIRQHNRWPFPSTMRLHKLLLSGSVVVAEKGASPCTEEKFVALSSSENFIEECELQLKLGRFAERGAEAFEKYSASLETERQIMRQMVEEALVLGHAE